MSILENLASVFLADQPGRTISTQAWTALIKQATGESPTVTRVGNKNVLVWKPGQAKKMQAFLERQISGKSSPSAPGRGPSQGGGLGFGNVDIDWKPVIIPLVIKKIWLPVTLYTGAIWWLSRYVKKKRIF